MTRPLFIVGTGRSGTTLLRAILNAHPALHLSKESSFFVATDARRFRRAPQEELARYFRSAPFRWLQLDPASVRARLPERFTRADAFRALLEADAERFGKRQLGDKTPAHALAVDALFEAFPDALVLHLVRDPRAVVRSLGHMPWGAPSPLANALWVEHVLRRLARDRRVHHVRFEDLLAAPEGTLRAILARARLPWSPRLLEHARHAPDDLGGLPWLRGALGPLRPPRPRAPADTDALVERVCRSAFEVYGYERDHAELELAPLLGDLPALGRAAARLAWLGLRPPPDGEAELRAWLASHPAAFARYPGWDPDRVVAASFGEGR